MTVLHIVPSKPFGGLQRIAALLAAEQQRCGLDVHLLAVYAGPEFEALLQSYGLPHTFIGGAGLSFHTLRQCREILSRNWSLLHIHSGLLWINSLALFSKRSPVVYHAHNYPPSDRSLKTRVLGFVNKSLVDLVIAVSKDVATAWRATGIGSAVEVVYNAVELPGETVPLRAMPSSQSFVFGIATRLARDKGIFEFLEVAAALHAHNSEARFVIAGEGPEKDELQNEIRRCGLSEVFLLPGYVSDLDAFWSSVDIALFTAPKEPFGLRILEAMIRRVPVVGYLTGSGSDEILCSGSTAVTAPYPDAEALAGAALDLCNNPNAHAHISNKAYDDVVKRFNTDSLHEGVMRAYRRVARI